MISRKPDNSNYLLYLMLEFIAEHFGMNMKDQDIRQLEQWQTSISFRSEADRKSILSRVERKAGRPWDARPFWPHREYDIAYTWAFKLPNRIGIVSMILRPLSDEHKVKRERSKTHIRFSFIDFDNCLLLSKDASNKDAEYVKQVCKDRFDYFLKD